MAKTETRIAFRITGFDCDPSLISTTLGIDATDGWQSGDLVPHSEMRRAVNGWVLRSFDSGELDLKERVSELLRALPDNLSALRSITNDWDAQLSCGVYARGQFPELNLSPAIVARLAALGASIDIDVTVVA